jgi:hypothetical protein
MRDYVRSTRGLTLTTLAIYLIPIKASILSRAIDLSVLQDITLLNVGPQIPFWNLLARENKNTPLAVRKIFTDNVTLPLLAFVSQLEVMSELFLLERTSKTRVESTAAKTTVTIEQIRKIVLKKHASTLKVLVVRNDAGTEWDFNVKTVMLLCQRAKNLEELACSFGIRTMARNLSECVPGFTANTETAYPPPIHAWSYLPSRSPHNPIPYRRHLLVGDARIPKVCRRQHRPQPRNAA